MSKNCMILTFSGVHHQVTEQQAEKIAMMQNNESATLNGNLIVKKNVSDILSMDKYYETYPNKRIQKIDEFKLLSGYGINGTIKYSSKNALIGMIKGLKKYISSTKENPCINWRYEKTWYQGTSDPIELLKNMENKLKTLNQAG